jgi:hypothetical protein
MDSSTTTAARPPEGRYGRRSDRDADRRLKAAGAVCGVLLLALVAWLGGSYLLRASAMNGAVTLFHPASDGEMDFHLSVTKTSGKAGVCTVRSQAPDGLVVGQSDFPVPAAGSSYEQDETLKTTARGTTAQLLGCSLTK